MQLRISVDKFASLQATVEVIPNYYSNGAIVSNSDKRAIPARLLSLLMKYGVVWRSAVASTISGPGRLPLG